MDQIKSYGDERTLAFCVFCGGATGTRDHCPSRVFLDLPYPDNLAVVGACRECNSGFSADEEYLACLVSCVIAGSTDPDKMPREKVRRILLAKPALREKIRQSQTLEAGIPVFVPERERVVNTLLKLARGHALYELHELCHAEPEVVLYAPLALLTNDAFENFERPAPSAIYPEVGSRAMTRLFESGDTSPGGWINVQPRRYRYHARADGGIQIRIVIHEYLACLVEWNK